jgi:tetratricopeptide (TPR) repeat protein
MMQGWQKVVLLAFAVALSAIRAELAEGADGRIAALDLLGRGDAAFRFGNIAEATEDWSAAIHMCRAINAPDLEAQALVERGEAYRVAGYFRDAGADLREALSKAVQSGDQRLVAMSSGALGNLAFLLRRSAVAEPLLRRSHDLAKALHDGDMLAASDNDLGNLYAAAGRPSEAAAAYGEAIPNALAAHDGALAATAEINAARLAFRDNAPEAAALLKQAMRQLQRMTSITPGRWR